MKSTPTTGTPGQLDTKLVWENGQAFMHCRDKGTWKTMTQFEVNL